MENKSQITKKSKLIPFALMGLLALAGCKNAVNDNNIEPVQSRWDHTAAQCRDRLRASCAPLLVGRTREEASQIEVKYQAALHSARYERGGQNEIHDEDPSVTGYSWQQYNPGKDTKVGMNHYEESDRQAAYAYTEKYAQTMQLVFE